MKKKHNDTLIKRAELFVRRKFTQRWLGQGPRNFVTVPKDVFGLSTGAKILLLRQDRIGDVLVSTPIIRILRERLPGVRIDMLLSRNNFAVREGVRHRIDRFLKYSKKLSDTINLFRAIRAEKYDLVIDLMDNTSTTSSYFVQWSGSRFSLGIAKENSAVYTHCVPLPDRSKVHIVERMAQLLLAFGIDPGKEDLSLEYFLSDEDRQAARKRLGEKKTGIRLGIHLAGSSRQRYWGEENYGRFFALLIAEFPQIEPLIFVPPGYEEEAVRISAANGAALAPAVQSFHEFAAMIRECDMIFTPDTSTVHLAAAWKIPSVVMFVDATLALVPWTPYKTPHVALLTDENFIAAIKPEEVIGALRQLVNRTV